MAPYSVCALTTILEGEYEMDVKEETNNVIGMNQSMLEVENG